MVAWPSRASITYWIFCSEVVKPAILETKALIPLVSKTGSLTAHRGVNGSEKLKINDAEMKVNREGTDKNR